MNTNKIIVKASEAKTGPVKGTGPGCVLSQKTAKKVSKPFILKDSAWLKMYLCLDVKAGDTVCFLYC
jgi:hypothetical protein